MSQLVLPIRLQDHAVFETFNEHGNEQVVDHLKRLAYGESAAGAWISGKPASGKSHLLQATCEGAGDVAVYLSSDLLLEAGADLLDGLENRRVIAIDDLPMLLGDRGWELALFRLYNALHASGGSLLVSAGTTQRETTVGLDDLASRLSQLPTFSLAPLAEAERMKALQIRAHHRGLELPDETAHYLLQRSRRDMASLYRLLDKLDLEALRAKRRLTIPFVREVLANGA